MRITELENAPDWLRRARTENENVELVNGAVIWHGGIWRGGIWRGGDWYGGDWRGGDWHDLKSPDVVKYYNPERGYVVRISMNQDDGVRIDSGCRHFDSFDAAETHWAAYPETLRLLRRFKRG